MKRPSATRRRRGGHSSWPRWAGSCRGEPCVRESSRSTPKRATGGRRSACVRLHQGLRRGLAKNRHRFVVASALANLFMMRKRLLRLQEA